MPFELIVLYSSDDIKSNFPMTSERESEEQKKGGGVAAEYTRGEREEEDALIDRRVRASPAQQRAETKKQVTR